MILTYIDSGVLIAASRGQDALSNKAFLALTDPNRLYASSIFVRLEVLPKSVSYRQAEDRELYEAFFQTVTCWAEDFSRITQIACDEAEYHGLRAIDALHVASAFTIGATELITAECHDRPIHKTKIMRVISIS